LAKATADAQQLQTNALSAATQLFADGAAGFAIAQGQALAAAAESQANDATALSTFLSSTAAAVPAMTVALAQAAETYANDGRAPYLAAVASAAAAQTAAINNMAPHALTASIDANAAAKDRVDATADAMHAATHDSIDASQARADDAANHVHQFMVGAIPEGVTEFTETTNAARDRSTDKIGLASQAQRDVVGPSYNNTITKLDAALTAANAAAGADDGVAVAAVAKGAADDVAAAWNHVNAVNARAAETFADSGPGGMTMAVGSMMAGVGDFFDGAAEGYLHYLTNPSEMEWGLRYGFYGLLGVAAASGTAAGILSGAAALGISQLGTVALSQLPAQLAAEYQMLTLALGGAGGAAARTNCFIAGTQVVVSGPFADSNAAIGAVLSFPEQQLPMQKTEANHDVLYAAGAFLIGAGLTIRPRKRSSGRRSFRRRQTT